MFLTNDNERFATELEAEQEMETLKAKILDAFSMAPGEEEIQSLLDEYEERYGRDLFWKMMAFDLAELIRDVDEMKSLARSMEADNSLSPVIQAVNKARVAYCQEDYKSAFEALDTVKTLEDNEESLVYLHLRGLLAFALHNYKEAVRCMEDVMLDVDDAQVNGITAICYLRLGDEKRASEAFERMIEQNKDSEYNWLFDLLTTFDEIDILAHSLFPREVANELEVRYAEEADLSFYDFERMVSSHPDFFVPVLLHMVDVMPNLELPCYFLGVAYRNLDDDKNAKKWFRKTLRLDWTSKNRPDTSFLFLRLEALHELNYSRQVTMRYLRELWEVALASESSSGRVALILYAAVHEFRTLVSEWLPSMPADDTLPDMERAELHGALLYYYYQIDSVSEAYKEACMIYEKNMFRDVISMLICAFLFRIFDYEGMRRYPDEQDYNTLESYMADQIIEMEQMRLDDDVEGLRTRLHSLDEIRKNRDEKAWLLFDDFLRIFAGHLGSKGPMRQLLPDVLDMIPSKDE